MLEKDINCLSLDWRKIDMKLYMISADGGNTWTIQWLHEHEVKEHKQLGYIVEHVPYVRDKRIFNDCKED